MEEQKQSPSTSQVEDIRQKLDGLGQKTKIKIMSSVETSGRSQQQNTKVVRAARRQSAAPSLLDRA